MKHIMSIRDRLRRTIAKSQCNVDDVSQCPNPVCKCAVAAEHSSFIISVIPEGYRDSSIANFDGKSAGRMLLDPGCVSLANTAVSQYCWGKDWLEVAIKDSNELVRMSQMLRRYESGANVVIHGDASRSINRSVPLFGQPKPLFGGETSSKLFGQVEPSVISENPIGRTFAAAIIMKEAINLRAVSSICYKHSYSWVEYGSLISMLKDDRADGVAEEVFCDWLVIDNIPPQVFIASTGMKAFTMSLLDPFLFNRLRDKKPTILVFRFDIGDKLDTIENSLGLAVRKIITGTNTWQIRLKGNGV